VATGVDDRHRQLTPIRCEVDLAGQPASGSAERFTVDRELFDPVGGTAPFPGPGSVLVGVDMAGVDTDDPLHGAARVVLDHRGVQDAFPGAVSRTCPSRSQFRG
jgi:hypothetical protein